MLNDQRSRRYPQEPIWSRWDVVCAISLVAACVLVSFALPGPGSSLFGG
jgi:hypothetical protein